MRLLLPGLSAAVLCVFGTPLIAQRIPQKAPLRPVPADTAPKAVIKPAPAPEGAKFAYLQGVVYDSIHSEPLAGALIQVDGTARLAVSDSLGRFLVDSVLPGKYRVLVDHPLLDTLGISMVTDSMTLVLSQVTRTSIAVPNVERLMTVFCKGRLLLGPGALVGRVREPDTEEPAVGARVSFVYYDPDPPGLPASLAKLKKTPKVREATVGADGIYRICGLPATFEGKLQAQRKDGGATAEVLVSQSDGLLALRSMSVAALPKVVATSDSGGTTTVAVQQKGNARVFGTVINASGAPVPQARVGLMGISAATLTKNDGTFVLDSVPSGTQALVIRKLGYRETEFPVELSARSPARATVKLGVFVPELTPVEVVSRRDAGLQRVGFLDRKRSAVGGHFLDEKQIDMRRAQQLTDLLRTVPGLRVQGTPGHTTVTSTRNSTGDGGCVTMYVDGAKWQQLEAGDFDTFVQPAQVAAIEVYNGTSTPPQFQDIGQSCSAVVVWTKLRVDSGKK